MGWIIRFHRKTYGVCPYNQHQGVEGEIPIALEHLCGNRIHGCRFADRSSYCFFDKHMSSRRLARERVMQALYAMEVGGGEVEHYLQNHIRPDIPDDKKTLRFAESLLIRTLDNKDRADEIIGRHTQNWELDRIALIDHIVLRIAVTELLTFEDIPPKVTLNEAIEIVKDYSTSRSGQFINGILDAIVIELHKNGMLRKSGRGLVGMEDLLGTKS
jgi:transcription antitermination protein NusB